MKAILAGGAVVTRQHPSRGTEVLIIHRPRYRDWSLPKGKLKSGESVPAAAVREVAEETGSTIRLGTPLDSVKYETDKGMKRVSYWGGTLLESVGRRPDNEVDVVSWLPAKAALKRLTYDQDRFLVEQFLAQPPTTPLIIVRHAKAMDRKDWRHLDAARPINARGRRQAALLVPMLGAYGIRNLISSSSSRCVSTLIPYAQDQNLVIDRQDILTEEEGTDDEAGVIALISKIREQVGTTGEPTAVCVHRPVLPHILEALELPPSDLLTGECAIVHTTADGPTTHAVERHRPQA